MRKRAFQSQASIQNQHEDPQDKRELVFLLQEGHTTETGIQFRLHFLLSQYKVKDKLYAINSQAGHTSEMVRENLLNRPFTVKRDISSNPVTSSPELLLSLFVKDCEGEALPLLAAPLS